MAKTKTSFDKKNQPSTRRGRSKQTLILEAIREKALLGLSESSTKDEAEKAVFSFLAEAAFNPTKDTAVVSNVSLNHIMKKGWPDIKSVMPDIEFTLTETEPSKQATEILKATSNGEIPPDIASMLITSMASVLKIKEVTELEERIKALENEQTS